MLEANSHAQASLGRRPAIELRSGMLPKPLHDQGCELPGDRSTRAWRHVTLPSTFSIHYTERLAQAGIEPSVDSVGYSHDNALAESINGLYKAEVIQRRGPWRSLEAVELATLEWVDWYTHRGLLVPTGNIPPTEAEALCYATQQNRPLAA